MELEKPKLVIEYSSIYNIENADKDKVSLFRVVMFGIIGALWKKNHIYTVLQYKDEADAQTIILDFKRDIDKLQPFIYRKMLEFKNM
jgi:Neuraminidase (sialidase)